MRNPVFCICETKCADQLSGNCKADLISLHAMKIVQSTNFLNPKFQASSHRMWLYSPVCAGPVQKPQR